MNKHDTGELIFLDFAIYCTFHKNMRQKHRDELWRCFRKRKKPRRVLLKYYFNNAYKNLRQLAVRTHKEIWSRENVINFWCHNHSDRAVEICNTYLTEVTKTTKFDKIDSEHVAITHKQKGVVNMRGLELKPGDQIYIHQGYAVIKKDALE